MGKPFGSQEADNIGAFGFRSIFGGDYSDVLYGYNGIDFLAGGGGNDRLSGGAGSDKLYGGLGSDKLFGGDGDDTFVYMSVSQSRSSFGIDTIYDLKSGDKMDLSDIDAKSKSSGDQTFSFIGTSAFHGKAGELRFDTKSSDTFIYGDLNGDKVADFALHLDDAVTLSRGYFVL
ncbi:hypothetical protein ABY43_28385 [Rhizobium giardinii]